MSNTESRSPTVTKAEATDRSKANAGPLSEAILAEVIQAVGAVRNGTVQIVIQDGVIVQIDRTEKRRLR